MDELLNVRIGRKRDAAMACTKAIEAVYDSYAKENILALRTNLETGLPYTQDDLDIMNAFIDAKRLQYKSYKEQITEATTEQEIMNIVFDYS